MALSKITTESLLDGEITLAKFGNLGSDGQVLTSTGGSSPPAFEAAGGGAWNLVATSTASNSASLDITGLSATYTTYACVFSNILPATDDVTLGMRIGDSSGFKSDTAYETHNQKNVNTAHFAYDARTGSNTYWGICEAVGNATGEGAGATVFLNCRGTRKPSMYGMNHSHNTSGAGKGGIVFGDYTTSVVTVDRVQIFVHSGNLTSGTFSVYGIAHA